MARALKMLSLVSGTFWGTALPGVAIQFLILNLGYTWYDLNYSIDFLPPIVVRITNFLPSIVSSTLNPIIYYYSMPNLRRATWKILGKNTASSEGEQM